MADKAFEQYGYVATLANSIPDLKKLLTKALAEKWSADEFSRNLQDSSWWKKSSDSVKQTAILRATKPGEYKQQMDQGAAKVRLMAGQMGVQLSASSANALADHMLKLGWDDATLQSQIGHYFKVQRGVNPGGQAGAMQQQLREIRMQYGLGGNDEDVAGKVRAVLMGSGTLEGFKAQYAAAAASKFPAFADQLKQGMTMQQIADPYVSTIAQTLELSPSKVDFYDPMVQRAMNGRDPKTGQPSPMALWQVQDMARQDKRYDHTTQAVNDAYSMVTEIGKSWGFKA